MRAFGYLLLRSPLRLLAAGWNVSVHALASIKAAQDGSLRIGDYFTHRRAERPR